LDPKRDKVGFISDKKVTKLLGRKRALKKRPTSLRAEAVLLFSNFLSFMKFAVLVLSTSADLRDLSRSQAQISARFFFTCSLHCEKRHQRGAWQIESPERSGRLLLPEELTEAYLIQLLLSSASDSANCRGCSCRM